MANLKAMSVADLLKLRSDIDSTLQGRRADLQKQLTMLGSERRAKSPHAGKKIAAKYRHPKTGEEWSGRGGLVKWLAAEIKAGRKKEEFLIKKASK